MEDQSGQVPEIVGLCLGPVQSLFTLVSQNAVPREQLGVTTTITQVKAATAVAAVGLTAMFRQRTELAWISGWIIALGLAVTLLVPEVPMPEEVGEPGAPWWPPTELFGLFGRCAAQPVGLNGQGQPHPENAPGVLSRNPDNPGVRVSMDEEADSDASRSARKRSRWDCARA